ncbi:MAG: archaellin/type IV pilin N-terminal domain-containing protein [Thermoplasmata archaeon]
MRVLYKKEKGVSPVIATILMVAITVVLASAVYLMVSGYIGSSPSKPVALSFSVSTNATATQFLVASGNISLSPSTPLIITIVPSGGSPITFKLNALSYQSSNCYYIWITSVTNTHYLAAGDILAISFDKTPLPPGTTVTFTYQGTVFYKYTA